MATEAKKAPRKNVVDFIMSKLKTVLYEKKKYKIRVVMALMRSFLLR